MAIVSVNYLEGLASLDIKLVMTNGCFDILHPGHISYLKQARKYGDMLAVAINSDESIKRLKGYSRPIMPLAARMEIMSSLWFVDYAVSFDDDTPEDLYKRIRPDVLVKGSEYDGQYIAGEKYAGRVELVKMDKEWSTTGIIERIKNA